MTMKKPQITSKDLDNMSTILELRENPVLAGELLLKRNYAPIQKFAIWGMWNHPFSMLDWGRGCGKCMSGETEVKVRTKAADNVGNVYTTCRLRDLFNDTGHRVTFTEEEEWWGVPKQRTEIMSMNPESGKLGWMPITAVFKQKRQEDGMLKITTAGGRSFRVTPKHRFLVRKKFRKLGFIQAQDLSIGKQLCIVKEGKIAYDEVIAWEKVDDTELEDFMYDLSITAHENYVANDTIVHNTTMASDIEVLSGLLYPGSASMIVSHSMKGTKLVFDEIIATWARSPHVKGAAERPVKGADECRIVFHSNGESGKETKVVGVATDAAKGGLGIRGRRVNRVLHIDEWVFLPRDLIDAVIMPCASNNEDPMAPPTYDLDRTRWIFTSSSGYTYMDAYDRMKDFRTYFAQGNPKYFYCNANYLDMPKGFIKEDALQIWMDTIQKKNPGRWETEIMARWISESGSWYNSKDIMGDPEVNGTDNPGGMWTRRENHHDVYYEESNHEDAFVLGVDPAEQQDETGYALIKVLPDKLVVMESFALLGQSMPEVAETIRSYMDRYNIVMIALDPEQGGRAGVVPSLKDQQPGRRSTLTGKPEVFLPVYPHKKFLKKNEEVPMQARMIIKYCPFSANSSEANLTDMNIAMRNMIKRHVLVAPLDFDQRNASEEGYANVKEEISKMMRQVVAVEAEPLGVNKDGRESKSASNLGRYSFTSKDKKDRWAALLIAAWEASIIQASMNLPEEDDESSNILILPSLFDPSSQQPQDPWSMFVNEQSGYGNYGNNGDLYL